MAPSIVEPGGPKGSASSAILEPTGSMVEIIPTPVPIKPTNEIITPNVILMTFINMIYFLAHCRGRVASEPSSYYTDLKTFNGLPLHVIKLPK